MHKISLFILALVLIACNSSKKSASNSEDSNTPQRVGEQLAPGTAKVRFTVDDVVADNNQIIWEVHVHEVLGYGSATPLINSDTKMSVSATTFMNYSERNSEYYMTKGDITGIFEAMGEQPGDYNRRTKWKLASIPE